MPNSIVTDPLPPLSWLDWALPLAGLVVIAIVGGLGLYAEWKKEQPK